MHKPEKTVLYQRRRDYIYRAASEDYSSDGFVFRAITKQDATNAARHWHSLWSWPRQYEVYNDYHADRFDLAIDYQKELFVLCYGKPSHDSLALEIDYMQKDVTIDVTIKALSLVEHAAYLYADLLNISELRLMYPVDKVIKHYEDDGYVIADKTAGGKVLSMSKPIKGTKGGL